MLDTFAKCILSRLPPEVAHDWVMRYFDTAATLGWFQSYSRVTNDDPVEVMGLWFPNPIGLAAGIDNNAQAVSAFGSLGFGFVEVGTVTASAQNGNPRPRLFRLKKSQALIHRQGFPNAGIDAVVKNLKSAQAFHLRGGVVGINIAGNPSASSQDNFVHCFESAYQNADYLALNMPSDNLGELSTLLSFLHTQRCRQIDSGLPYKPIVIKLSADLSHDTILAATDAIVSRKLDGIIAIGSMANADSLLTLPHGKPSGALSGAPLSERSNAIVETLCSHLQGTLPVIASGGVMSAEDARRKIELGASLVQLCSALYYHGPHIVADCIDAAAQARASLK